MTDYSLYINGGFRKTDVKEKIINPATGEIIAQVYVSDKKDVELALSSARHAFDTGLWKDISLDRRKEFILGISQGILKECGELAKLETQNNGKPIKESTFMDIPLSANAFKYFANNLEGFLKEEYCQIPSEIANAESILLREPRGVVVLIVPWNYPLLIASWKLSQALSAGNTVILKPSSLTPLTSLELARIIHEVGLPKGVVNVIPGSGLKIGRALCSDKRVDLISFTGSNEAGREIIGYSSKEVKKLIMELGGKSASIIFADADFEAAINGSLCSIFLNQGQMCTAMSRIFVEDKIYDKFLEDFTQKTKRIKLGNGSDYETQMGPLISKGQRDRILSFVQKAKQDGAKLVCGGKIPNDERLKSGFFFEPTVFTDVSPKMSIFQEEVFGPVVCLGKFSGEKEAVTLANDSNFGLAASLWTKDILKAQSLATKINAGTIWINTYGMFFNESTYGGFKQSGFGKELGREGFLEYTRLKNVITDKTKEAKPLVNYWYGF